MKKKIAPKKKPDHYWNTIERTLTQSGGDVFMEAEIQTGVAVGQKRIMLIKKIAVSYGIDISATIAPGADVSVFVNLHTQQGEATLPGLQDSGTIYFHALALTLGGDGATAAESPGFLTTQNGMPTYVEFDDPIPVADDTLSLYFDTNNITTAQTCVIKIWYAIADVSLEEALTILESYR